MKKIIILIVLIQVTIRIQSQPSTIHVNNQDIFINGMNLAWISFANDIGSGYDQAKFTQAVTAIHAAGGNTLRWWIHVNGTNNPKFTNDSVTGINTSDLKNLKNALDIAYQNGVLIDLCLWSFDMLQSGLTADQVTRNQLFLSDSNYTKAYIRNALIPMVKYLNNHPAILCWEVFNEPEGMCSDVLWKGWTPNLTSIKNVQRVINQVAGAIHRTAPKALVSNGSQIIMYSSDVNGYINYYRSDRLLNEGHDPLGYLDFYMVHYYTNNGTQFSLFHKPASYWNLDKPLVIGEFPALGFTSETPKMTPVQSYEYAAANGYAGAMSWTYSNGTGGATGGDKNGGLPDCAAALDSIETKYKTYVDVIPSKSFIFTPTVKNILPEGMAFLGNTDTATMFNLKNYFILRGDTFGSNLVFKVDSQKTLAKIVIDKNGVIKVVPTKKSGILSTTISAININDTTKSISSPFIFSIVDTNSTNHLQYRNVFSSTIESVLYQPIYAVDSSSTTRWSTTYQDKQWLLIDMAKEFVLQQVKIRWEAAYGQQYQLQV